MRAQKNIHEIEPAAEAMGTWCSGITSASHAEGPGFKSQCVHFCLGFDVWLLGILEKLIHLAMHDIAVSLV